MRIDVAAVFPGMFASPLGCSMIARAQEGGLVRILVHDLRDYTSDRHRAVDDYPYGGGPGMVIKPEPFFEFVDHLLESARSGDGAPATRPRVVLLSPGGTVFDARVARRLAREPWLALLCGHYEGVDDRVRQFLADEELSIGDFVLTGGELPAMVVIDAVVRLLPGVLGSGGALNEESFTGPFLEYPQYTRPAEFRGHRVPDVLLSGDHAAVDAWRRREARRRTEALRPDLLDRGAPGADRGKQRP